MLQFRVQVQNRQRRYKIDRASAASFCDKVLRAVEKRSCALSAVFVGIHEMTEVNTRYRQRNHPTDVLSFGYGDIVMEGMPFLGEILISPEVAHKNASSYRISPDREIKRLLIHGILHLSGYNHETDSGEMQQTQARLMRRSFVRNADAVIADLKACP